jgi:hypothetical protein
VLGVIALAATLALALPASATHTNQTDPNDTAGRLDVRTVLLAHDETPRWRIDTFAAWTIRRLWDRGFLTVELDTLGDAGVDHLVVIRSDGRELTATLVRVRADGSHRVIAILDADKDGPGGAAVSVALRRLAFGSDRTSYRWSVTTSFVGGACPQTCLDHVPDEDMIEQPLPGVTPTPSPTPSPTPTPSAG